VSKHVQIDRYYAKHGRFRNQPLSQEEIQARIDAGEVDAEKAPAPDQGASKQAAE